VPTRRRTLYHYTTEKGLEGILASNTLRASRKGAGRRDVRHGEGQYVSDVVPGTKRSGQLAYLFLNDPRGWRRFTHYVEIDVTELMVLEGRLGVFVIPNNQDLDLTGRITGSGPIPGPVGR
jgi:hypothetical protein